MILALVVVSWPAAAAAQANPAHPAASTQPVVEQARTPEAQGGPTDPSHGAQPRPKDAHAPPPGAPPEHGTAQHGDAGSHAASPWPRFSQLVNFLILVGGLYYLLRKPLGQHLSSRGRQIRADLVDAKEIADRAGAQLAEIDRRLKELPAELAALRARGEEEIANERSRIEDLARAERQRLLEQTRREIELQLRLAKRTLADHAATLAVELAKGRLTTVMTPRDQERLVDRYIAQVKDAHE
jgi:F-type H+-transporting ATPase subunit b